MIGIHTPPALRLTIAGAAVAFALGASEAAFAEQIHWPFQQQTRPVYRSAPTTRSNTTVLRSSSSVESGSGSRASNSADSATGYRPTSSNESSSSYRPITTTSGTSEARQSQAQQIRPAPQPVPVAQPAPVAQSAPTTVQQQTPQPTQTRPQQTTKPEQQAAKPSAAEPQRRPQAFASNAESAQAATSCMNERNSSSLNEAIESCDGVIDETLKNLANAYYFRATAKFGKSDIEGAIGDYSQALRIDPEDADYFSSRAAAFEAKNEMSRALADYDAAIKAAPQSIYSYNNRGAAYQRKGDYARAAADYGEVTRLQPDNIDAWSARCWVRAISPGQTQMALNDCNTALKIKADAADVLDTRGFVYLKLGQTDNAINDYDSALKIDAKLAGSLYGRGIAKTRKGDRTGGSADIDAAKAIKSDIAEEFKRYGVQ